MPKLLYLVAGARPNFMKIAPIIRALQRRPEDFAFRLVHTGQHYDREMSGVFFEELGIPAPDHHLDCGGGSHAEQTAKIMVAFEKICTMHPPDCVLVVGDVNSTLACAIVAKKLQLPVAHVEAGLRSGDRTMPEEINRLVTDSISDWFFCTEPAGVDNLRREGQPEPLRGVLLGAQQRGQPHHAKRHGSGHTHRAAQPGCAVHDLGLHRLAFKKNA